MSSNRLQSETSPYLLQHAHNPVDWYAWGEEALAAAREQNKPIFLSIGYSTCYWCHMMEKDSFELQEVADLLNGNFISIKVDREERPDIDHVYMEAVMAMTGRGGWPMSVFLTPDLKPFWGGTFFRRRDFMQILEDITRIWKSAPSEIENSAGKILLALEEEKAQITDDLPDGRVLDWVLKNYDETFDPLYGGFGQAPKFPPSQQISLLLRVHRRTGNDATLHMATATLRNMAAGGIYDHLGGGFSRYSTDERWLVPHFEKMLYDNALLAWTYTEAWQLTKDDMFADVARETIDYVLREMTSPQGGFFSAQDAGEAGREGEYYVWKYAELKSLLSESELAEICRVFSVTETGNFENAASVISLNAVELWKERANPVLKRARDRLYQHRLTRERPRLDDKIITGWNALMISALALASRAFGESRYLEAASRSCSFLLQNLYTGKKLLRSFCREKASIDACAEDYAYLIDALLNLYQADFDPEHLLKARELQILQNSLFWDAKNGGYFISAAPDLFRRRKDLHDGAVPSANSVSLHNLYRLQKLFPDDALDKFRLGTLKNLSLNLLRFPQALPRALWCFDPSGDLSRELLIACSRSPAEAKEALDEINNSFNPDLSVYMNWPEISQQTKNMNFFAGKSAEHSIRYYLCRNFTCEAPVANWNSTLLRN